MIVYRPADRWAAASASAALCATLDPDGFRFLMEAGRSHFASCAYRADFSVGCGGACTITPCSSSTGKPWPKRSRRLRSACGKPAGPVEGTWTGRTPPPRFRRPVLATQRLGRQSAIFAPVALGVRRHWRPSAHQQTSSSDIKPANLLDRAGPLDYRFRLAGAARMPSDHGSDAVGTLRTTGPNSSAKQAWSITARTFTR